jgi:hypothetical protein
MCEALPILVEKSVEIARGSSQRIGALGEPAPSGKILIYSVEKVIQKAESRKLMFSNKAIIECQKLVAEAA